MQDFYSVIREAAGRREIKYLFGPTDRTKTIGRKTHAFIVQ